MRQRNFRLVSVGSVLILAAIGFFLFMLSIASQSTHPRELMSTVGSVCGVLMGVASAMIIIGLIGRKPSAAAAAPRAWPGSGIVAVRPPSATHAECTSN